MSISSETSRVSYSGNGATLNFAFAHLFLLDTDLTVILVDDTTKVETVQTLVTHYAVSGVGTASGGMVDMIIAPATGTTLVIYRDPPITQVLELSENDILPVEQIEAAFDKLTQIAQRNDNQASRSVRLPEGFTGSFDPRLPGVFVPGNVLAIKPDGSGFEYQATVDGPPGPQGEQGLPGQGLPTPVTPYSLVESDATPTAFTETASIVYSGISILTGTTFTSQGIKDTLDKIIRITYTAPALSLAGAGSGTLRERGDPVINPLLTATVTKKSDPVASLTFYDTTISVPNIIGSAHVGNPPVPNGGVDTQATSVTFSTNRTFRARVIDDGTSGGPTNTDASVSFSFVYPYYSGPGASGLTPAQVATLTKEIINSTATKVKTFSVTAGEKIYFAYPASYSSLTSILDVNNFETIGDWTLTTANITGLDASAVSYKIYSFNNLIGVTGSYQYTFKQ